MIDSPTDKALKRRLNRGKELRLYELGNNDQVDDRPRTFIEFQQKVRRIYLDQSKKHDWVILDGNVTFLPRKSI